MIARIVPFCVGMLVLSSCSEFRKVDEMRENTVEMNKTTKELLDETRSLKGVTDKMTDTTSTLGDQTGQLLDITKNRLAGGMESVDAGFGELYDALRQGDSVTLRRTSIHNMKTSQSIQNCVAEAGIYLMSFEYQLFGGFAQDTTEARRHVLYHQAMMEFFLRIDELAPTGGRVWPEATPDGDPSKEKSRAAAFNCFAGVIHKTNRKQAQDPNFKTPTSVYSLIISALKAKPKIDSGEMVLPAGHHYMKEVLARPRRVEQLLQTRHNMFVYLLLGGATDMIEKSKLGQMTALIKGIEINVASSAMNAAHLDFLTEEVLLPALETKRDMIALGMTPKLTKMTGLLASRIRLVNKPENGEKAIPLLENKRTALQAMWAEYLGGVTEGEGK